MIALAQALPAAEVRVAGLAAHIIAGTAVFQHVPTRIIVALVATISSSTLNCPITAAMAVQLNGVYLTPYTVVPAPPLARCR